MKHKQSELKIRISQLSEGIHHYQFTSTPIQLGLEENFKDDVEITAELDKSVRQLYLKTQIFTKAGFRCDRCNDEFFQPIRASYGICYALDETASNESVDDELRLIHPGTPYIELTDDVRQMIMLTIPMKITCFEGCKGLCPHCGINRNLTICDCKEEHEDSRWDELRKLITENNN